MNEETPIFPIASWEAGAVPALGVFIFRPHFLSSPMQPVEQAKPSRHYALTAAQLRALILEMQKALPKLESGAAPAPGIPRH